MRLNAHIAMIPKIDGDSTPPGERPLCVLPAKNWLWASLRLGHLTRWFQPWMPNSVFSAGGGRSSVEAWYSTALEIEEALVGGGDSRVLVLVADVVESFDTVDRVILDFVLGRLGLPGWFSRVFSSYLASVRSRWKLSFWIRSALGSGWRNSSGPLP